MKKMIALAAVAASFSAPAFAQDVRPAFTGPYVAGMIGYDRVRLSVPSLDASDSKDGLLYGGVVGYDINVSGAVFGIEAEYADSNTKETVTDILVANDRAQLRSGRDLYAGIRIGGEIVENVMVYGKGGYTNARAKLRYDDGVDVYGLNTNLEGYRLGAGVETNMAGLLGRLEYRYSSYGNHLNSGIETERHQVALLVGYRF